jgi:hypothetical protein
MTNPVAVLRGVSDKGDSYKAIFLWCPGCEYIYQGSRLGGLHLLPVSGNTKKRPTWKWNGDLVHVTLSPSILTRINRGNTKFVCHSFLQNGMWRFLGDSTHGLANNTSLMIPLPDWVVN